MEQDRNVENRVCLCAQLILSDYELRPDLEEGGKKPKIPKVILGKQPPPPENLLGLENDQV